MTSSRPNAPFTTLRSWMDRLAETGRLARTKPDVPLEFTLAAIAKRYVRKVAPETTPRGPRRLLSARLVAARLPPGSTGAINSISFSAAAR